MSKQIKNVYFRRIIIVAFFIIAPATTLVGAILAGAWIGIQKELSDWWNVTCNLSSEVITGWHDNG